MRKAFTLIEILIVLAIIGVLAAVVLPVCFRVQAKSRQAVCVSNLKQLGMAVAMYGQDNDGFFPHGGDPTDIRSDIWQEVDGGEFADEAKSLRPLTFVLKPYVKNSEVWRCPADTGFDIKDGVGVALNARPTSYDAFGMSYYYRTELTLRRRSTLVVYERLRPFTEHGAESINVLFDGHGAWHGGWDMEQRRYNVLMADGHVSNLTRSALDAAWKLTWVHPGSNP
jgi:general secretion pathway protein G